MNNRFRITMLCLLAVLCVFLYEKSSIEAKTGNLSTGTVTDIDGNVYKTAQIGDQIWMAENLKVTHYQNGEPIPNVIDSEDKLTTGVYCNYDLDPDNAVTYGRLYNWFAVNDSRNIAPKGWHVPNDGEWQTLIDYLGGSHVAGIKLKSANGWNSNGNGPDDYGFCAQPGGYRDCDGHCTCMGNSAAFWSSTEYHGIFAWYRLLDCTHANVYRYCYSKQSGYSVRCVKNNY